MEKDKRHTLNRMCTCTVALRGTDRRLQWLLTGHLLRWVAREGPQEAEQRLGGAGRSRAWASTDLGLLVCPTPTSYLAWYMQLQSKGPWRCLRRERVIMHILSGRG